MIRKAEDCAVELREKMRDGEGVVEIKSFVNKDELYNKGRLFAKLRLAPGCSIGYHVHQADSEIFYIQKGTAVYNDNGSVSTVCKGDVLITAVGQGHSIKNESSEDVEIIALIINP